jgi:hypothetical protein
MKKINNGGSSACRFCGNRNCGYVKGLEPVRVTAVRGLPDNLDVWVGDDEAPFGRCCRKAAAAAGFFAR